MVLPSCLWLLIYEYGTFGRASFVQLVLPFWRSRRLTLLYVLIWDLFSFGVFRWRLFLAVLFRFFLLFDLLELCERLRIGVFLIVFLLRSYCFLRCLFLWFGVFFIWDFTVLFIFLLLRFRIFGILFFVSSFFIVFLFLFFIPSFLLLFFWCLCILCRLLNGSFSILLRFLLSILCILIRFYIEDNLRFFS